MDIYRYMQPEAVKLFKTVPGFKEKYLKTMENLSSENAKNHPHEALSALIRDYLEEFVDWDGSREEKVPVFELYKSVFAKARKFVLPMNPPRVELDTALKSIFAEHGLQARKPRFHIEKSSAKSHAKSHAKSNAKLQRHSVKTVTD